MQYLKLPPNPCYCCRVQLMLCIIHFRFFSGMVQYMLVFSTSVEVASKRHLVKSFYSSKCSHNPSGIILTRIGCLAPAGCTVSVCIQLHWQNSCFKKSHIRSFPISLLEPFPNGVARQPHCTATECNADARAKRKSKMPLSLSY